MDVKGEVLLQLLNKSKLKNLVQIRLVVFEKNIPLIPKNDVTELMARKLCHSNYGTS